MIAILLVALFAATAFGSAIVLADSAVRGRNAFRQLRGQLARLEHTPQVRVALIQFDSRRAFPVLRQRCVSAARPVRRPARSLALSLHAAA